MHTSIRFLTFFLTCTVRLSVRSVVHPPSPIGCRRVCLTRGDTAALASSFFATFLLLCGRFSFLPSEPPLHSLSFFLFRYCHLNGLVSRAPVTAGAEGARRGRLLHSDMTLPCPKLPFQWNAGGQKKGMTAKDDVIQEWEWRVFSSAPTRERQL